MKVGFGGWGVWVIFRPTWAISLGFLEIHGIYLTTVKPEKLFRKVTLEVNSN